ncbi:vacuolar protein sorting-associated protein 62-like [Ananas comosus]|uniref:Vacuolar protein sorting-associated protein 62-like n=1 Tax=Ananas comosus TaxID=4615 RepID=A0A199UTX3_ANACO|nr:vacuolar protein sorting-associated protein 62-like [Ananas comosus]OAY68090.1 hypothetical protein ACMD2_25335 [Ananas comosus]
MDWWRCLWEGREGRSSNPPLREPEPFSLPSPIPHWPRDGGFAQGIICIGDLEVVKITKFERVWSYRSSKLESKGAALYKPIEIPEGFFVLGHYGQLNDRLLHGFVLVARETFSSKEVDLPALQRPQDYTFVWSSNDLQEDNYEGESGYFWLPCPQEGYKAVGFLVTREPNKPSLDEVRCVRSDLTDKCEAHSLILSVQSESSDLPFRVWSTRPSERGMWAKGVPVGSFSCSTSEEDLTIACLNNIHLNLSAMPKLDQINSLIKHYGPTVFFHPKELYLPSSVSWFFKNGATLHKKGEDTKGEAIEQDGTNLPRGGDNDGEYWIDLPNDDRSTYLKLGNLESAELYVHVKPALGGTFTDIAMWVFCPFNGPATLKIGVMNFPLGKIGQHVGDWEHFTLRISNFSGELWSLYFSQHSGGAWVDTPNLEYVEGNKAVVYSSKSGHASFPHRGNYLQGSRKLGIGIRNDAVRSNLTVDSSVKHRIVAAEYLGDVIDEPCWLQFMREWGPKIVYNSRTELEKILSYFPFNLRYKMERMFNKLPPELYGEEGPTGPKEKNNWVGDERG